MFLWIIKKSRIFGNSDSYGKTKVVIFQWSSVVHCLFQPVTSTLYKILILKVVLNKAFMWKQDKCDPRRTSLQSFSVRISKSNMDHNFTSTVFLYYSMIPNNSNGKKLKNNTSYIPIWKSMYKILCMIIERYAHWNTYNALHMDIWMISTRIWKKGRSFSFPNRGIQKRKSLDL